MIRQTFAKGIRGLALLAYILALCIAGIVVAFLASLPLLGLTPAQLQQPSSLLFILVFLCLVFVFVVPFPCSATACLSLCFSAFPCSTCWSRRTRISNLIFSLGYLATCIELQRRSVVQMSPNYSSNATVKGCRDSEPPRAAR